MMQTDRLTPQWIPSRHVIVRVLLLTALPLLAAQAVAAPAEYVIQISVDGLAPRYIEDLLAKDELPTFARLQAEGAWTHNARTDFDYTVTLPNHTCMVTGRPVKDKAAEPTAIAGHMWFINRDPEADETIHSQRHDYVASTFDVAHDAGLRTAMFASKGKFAVYDQSYDRRHGAPDKTGKDNGRDKIDVFNEVGVTWVMTGNFLKEMKANPINYTFLHYRDTDTTGHATGWGSEAYLKALRNVDTQLGQILDLVTSDERFKGKTAIILSADHGGTGRNHGYSTDRRNYQIPFYVWGAGVDAGKDLYALNGATRANPKDDRPDYVGPSLQPIRNGDGGNLALTLLGLPAIPGSVIDAKQDLKVAEKR